MARARNIKPAFFDNEYLSDIPPLSRLLFIGLWCLADREGRLELRPKRIKAQLFAYDDCDINEMISQLKSNGFIDIYSHGNGDYIQVKNWKKHQNPHHKEVASIIPKQEDHKDTVCDNYIPLSNTIRNNVYEIQGRVCCCCSSTESLEIDHKLPVSKGGNSIIDNLQVLCRRCNIKKFDNFIDFSKLPIDKLSIVKEWFMHDSSMNKERFMEIASWPTDSLNLIPDTLNLNPSTDCQPSVNQHDLNIVHLFDFWKEAMKKSGATKLDSKRKTAIKNRLKDGYSVEDIQLAIINCSLTPHNMGQNDRGQKFNDIELICRNAANLERFMESKPLQAQQQSTDFVGQQSVDNWADGLENEFHGVNK